MAESVISYVVESLSDQIIQKAKFLKGVDGQVEWLRNELERMQCFLKEADVKQEDDELVKNWVKDIRNAAYEAEDIVDTFIFRIESWRRRSFIKRYAHFSKELFYRRKVGKKIDALKATISDITRSCKTYGIRNIGEGTASTSGETVRQLRRSSPRGIDKDIIGMEVDVTQLVSQLLEKENPLTLSVISLVGMGGIGKTTLAMKVFNHGSVRGHFKFIAWISVSQEYKRKDMLLGIIRQVTEPKKELQEKIDNMQEEELEKMLCEHLQEQEKKYLVVLDDIWTTEAWDLLKRAFPNMNNGSKVMLTTRNRDVALHADRWTAPYELHLLDKKDSWGLFLRNTFHDGNCPLEFGKVGRRIVEKCGGLPLAIIVAGGLLSGKCSVSEWERVLNNMNSLFAKDDKRVLAILALSYNDLPCYLKSCFLHLGIFPEDYVISTRKLFHLWFAEGLIPQCEERMEVKAENYLNELIDRNMVQVVKTNANKRVKQCRLHDLLRDLSISKAKEEIFLEIHGQMDFRSSKNSRHHAVHSNFEKYLVSIPSMVPNLRSLLLFRPGVWPRDDIKTDCISTNLKRLRVLDLENTRIFEVERKMGNLINLRYLSLKHTWTKKLPSSMKYLESLQTLDISENPFISKIPKFISKLKNLQHLYVDFGSDVKGKLRMDTLKNLQSLSSIHIDKLELKNPGSLNLCKLKVYLSSDSDVNRFCISIAKLEKLQSLKLSSVMPGGPLPSLASLSQCHRLTKLSLRGVMNILPLQHEFPTNILQLTLHRSFLRLNPMEVLKQLPRLSILRLRCGSYTGDQMAISAGGFPLLEFLELEALFELQEMTIEDGAMPRLKHFRVSDCDNLLKLPVGIMFAVTLEELEICSMPSEFVNRLRGRDFYKVKHIPSITYSQIGARGW